MKIKNTFGGILLYVMILGMIIASSLALSSIFFGNTITQTLDFMSFDQKDLKKENIVISVITQFAENEDYDTIVPLSQNDFVATRFTKEFTPYLYADTSSYEFVFHQNMRESLRYHPITKEELLNDLDSIQGFIVYWNMKDSFTEGVESEEDITTLRAYNSLSQEQNADIKIFMQKKWAHNDEVFSEKCFLSSDVLDPPFSGEFSGVFKNSLLLKESYFKRSSDCISPLEGDALSDPIVLPDPYFGTNIFLDDALTPLDFENFSYVLRIESLAGDTHIRVTAIGNGSETGVKDGGIPIQGEVVLMNGE
jgi:hypothetical protein